MDSETLALFGIAERLQTVKYFNVASLSLLILDFIMTVEGEVSMIWPTRMGPSKLIFFVCRYMPFVNIIIGVYYTVTPGIATNVPLCKGLNETMTWFLLIGVIASEVILIIRTFVLYGRSKRVLAWLLTMFIAAVLAIIPINAFHLKTIQYKAQPLLGLSGCYYTTSSIIVLIPFVLLFLFESLIVGMTIRRGLSQYRNSKSTLTRTLYHDGLIFFLCTLLFTILNVIVMGTLAIEYADLLISMQGAIHSIISTRILLHIHKASPARSASQAMTTENGISLGPISRTNTAGTMINMTVNTSTTHDVNVEVYDGAMKLTSDRNEGTRSVVLRAPATTIRQREDERPSSDWRNSVLPPAPVRGALSRMLLVERELARESSDWRNSLRPTSLLPGST